MAEKSDLAFQKEQQSEKALKAAGIRLDDFIGRYLKAKNEMLKSKSDESLPCYRQFRNARLLLCHAAHAYLDRMIEHDEDHKAFLDALSEE